MGDLKKQVSKSAADLQMLWTMISRRRGQTVLPVECYTRWEKLALLYASLEGTVPLFDTRDSAWRVVESLVDPKRIQSEKARQQAPQPAPQPGPAKTSYNFSHDGIQMDFSSARHLALVSYMGISWSIYDRLTNVCGRLAATDEVIQHPKQNPKLVEDLLTKPKERADQGDSSQHQRIRGEYGSQLLAFSTQHHVRMAFDWPIRVSYAIRNWLIHEGQSMGTVRLFHSDRIEDGLQLHSNCVEYIERSCSLKMDENGDPSRCCLRGSESPWKQGQSKDLLKVISLYHIEMDSMLAGLLRWCTESFIGQLTIFSDRDKAVLAVAAATKQP